MEEDKSIYITINHLDNYLPVMNLKVGDILTLKKEPDNIFDDEAIAVYTENSFKCGYVANSVSSVARGTYSAGRIYDIIDVEQRSTICFITDDEAIARVCL